MTLEEYRLLMKAAQLRRVDEDYRNHLQAFLNFAAQSQKKAGKDKTKPVYTTFKKFYDYEKQIEKVMDQEAAQRRLRDIKKIMEGG